MWGGRSFCMGEMPDFCRLSSEMGALSPNFCSVVRSRFFNWSLTMHPVPFLVNLQKNDIINILDTLLSTLYLKHKDVRGIAMYHKLQISDLLLSD